MRQVTLHFLLLAAAGVLVILVSSESDNETMNAVKKLIEEEQMNNEKATQTQSQLSNILQNGISESLQKVNESSEKLKELVSELKDNLSQIPKCALPGTKSLQNIAHKFYDFSSSLASSKSIVTGKSQVSLAMFLQMKSFATFSSLISSVITYHIQSLQKHCQQSKAENDLKAIIEKRHSELKEIYDEVENAMKMNILKLLSWRNGLLKESDKRNLRINFKTTDVGGYALRDSDLNVLARFRRESTKTKSELLRKLSELCHGLDREMCQNNLDDYYPLKKGEVLEKTLFPAFDIEKITFKIKHAENCVENFREYRKCEAMKNIMPMRFCPFPLCTLK